MKASEVRDRLTIMIQEWGDGDVFLSVDDEEESDYPVADMWVSPGQGEETFMVISAVEEKA